MEITDQLIIMFIVLIIADKGKLEVKHEPLLQGSWT